MNPALADPCSTFRLRETLLQNRPRERVLAVDFERGSSNPHRLIPKSRSDESVAEVLSKMNVDTLADALRSYSEYAELHSIYESVNTIAFRYFF